MRAVVEGRLPAASDAFQTHIDRCLGCRACEPVCPSGVEYGLLLESAREVAFRARKPQMSVRALLSVFRRGVLLRSSMAFARMARGLGLAWLGAKLTPGFRWLHPMRFGLAMLAASRGSRLLSTAAARSASSPVAVPAGDAPAEGDAADTPAVGDVDAGGIPQADEGDAAEAADAAAGDLFEVATSPPSGPLRVALLTGCVQAGLFARVNDATERVLRANGFEIVPVAGQKCCGALHVHAGDAKGARRLARANVAAFEKSKIDFVAVNAAGCGATLKEYGHLLAGDSKYAETAARLADASRDVSELLAVAGVRSGAPVPLRVTYDAACHLCHAQRLTEAPRAMLEAIPELDLVPLPDEEECCGGAGIYGMTHPELGGSIGADKVASVIGTGAAAVVTANPGCIMQIGAGLLLRGSRIKAHHPVELLDESYKRAGFYR